MMVVSGATPVTDTSDDTSDFFHNIVLDVSQQQWTKK
jgi:hypothetical protein